MKRVHIIILIAVLVAIIATIAIINMGGSKDNTTGATSISITQKNNEEVKNENSSKFLDGYGIIYDFNDVPTDFLQGYELGFENFGMNNKQIFEKRLEDAVGKKFGYLNLPKVQYDVFGNLNDKPYILTINKGGWLYTKGVNIFDNEHDYTLYSLNNNLFLNEINIEIEKISKMRKYGTSDEYLKQNGWVASSSNGWTIYKSSEEKTNYACLFYFIDEELVMTTKLYKSDSEAKEYMTTSDFEEYIKKFTESVYFTKVNDTINEKILVHNTNEEISIGEKFILTPFKDTYLTSWSVVETKDKNWNKIPTNLVGLKKTDGTRTYSIYEYYEGTTLESIKDEEHCDYTTYTTNAGLTVEIEYNKTLKEYSCFFIAIDGRYYQIYSNEVYGKSNEITSLEEMKKEVEYVFTNIIKYN